MGSATKEAIDTVKPKREKKTELSAGQVMTVEKQLRRELST